MQLTTPDGAVLAYDAAGAGPDTLLLVHGHPFDRSMWRGQLEAAAAVGWSAVAPDLRGYGESPGGAETVPLDVFARDLAALADHLGAGGVALGGLSMGGQIVMEFCRLFSARVRGVLLAATSPRAETEEGKANRRRTAERLLRDGMADYAAELLPKMLSPRSIDAAPDVADYVLGMMRAAPAAGAAAALRGRAERPSYEPTLARLPAPALIVVGDSDAFTTREDADLMHSLLRRSELLWLEGVGHMPNLESPARFNAALTGFLQRL